MHWEIEVRPEIEEYKKLEKNQIQKLRVNELQIYVYDLTFNDTVYYLYTSDLLIVKINVLQHSHG